MFYMIPEPSKSSAVTPSFYGSPSGDVIIFGVALVFIELPRALLVVVTVLVA
jgi:hypothetical protein